MWAARFGVAEEERVDDASSPSQANSSRTSRHQGHSAQQHWPERNEEENLEELDAVEEMVYREELMPGTSMNFADEDGLSWDADE